MTKENTSYSLLLINPRRSTRFNWDLQETIRLMGKKTVSTPLALPLLAALTPSQYDIRIIDEDIETIPKAYSPDIVGITALVSNISRAYEIADHYLSRKIPVILGGSQVSFNKKESAPHATSLVIGEAEELWEKVLSDFECDNLQPIYESSSFPSFNHSPVPRWDLVKTSKMMAYTVQVSRGCPYKCDFCLVKKMFGQKQRYRHIDNVLAEIQSLPSGAIINFADDNLTANKGYAREFLTALTVLKRVWTCQASLETALDMGLLSQMKEAGCTSILIGFESLDKGALKASGKTQNLREKYETAISNVHRAGMHIVASFVVGFDTDTEKTFDDIFRFTQQQGLSYVMVNALFAYEGTDFYNTMKVQNRLRPSHSDFCSGLLPNITFSQFTRRDLFEGILRTLERIYDCTHVAQKAQRIFSTGSFHEFKQGRISFLNKIRTYFYVLKSYKYAPERGKRVLYRTLSKLVNEHKISRGTKIQFILFIDSFKGYISFVTQSKETIHSLLRDAPHP